MLVLALVLALARSGVGEAIVAELGMPLRDETEDDARLGRTRGDLIVKFAVELPRCACRVGTCSTGIVKRRRMRRLIIITSITMSTSNKEHRSIVYHRRHRRRPCVHDHNFGIPR